MPKHSKGRLPKPPTANPKEADARPLTLEYFEMGARSESFSSEVVRRLSDGPFFRPAKQPDGFISDRDMLTVASVVIAAADREIAATERVRERLGWWNAPLLQKPVATAADGHGEDVAGAEGDQHEIAWFAKYLTLRNILGALVVLTAAAWTLFVFIDSEKKTQIQTWKDKLTVAEAQLSAVQTTDSIIRENANGTNAELVKLRAQIDKDNSALSAAHVEVQKQTDRAASLQAELSRAKQTITDTQRALDDTRRQVADAQAKLANQANLKH